MLLENAVSSSLKILETPGNWKLLVPGHSENVFVDWKFSYHPVNLIEVLN